MSLRRMSSIYMREMLEDAQHAHLKVAGLHSNEGIDLINELKPDLASFLVDFPSARHHVSRESLENLIFKLDPEIPAIGCFIDQPLGLVSELADTVLDMVQLCGNEPDAYIVFLRELVDIPICQAIRLTDEAAVEKANSSIADIVMLGAGKNFHEPIDLSLLDKIERPYILACPPKTDEKSISKALADPRVWGLSLLEALENGEGRKDRVSLQRALDQLKYPRMEVSI